MPHFVKDEISDQGMTFPYGFLDIREGQNFQLLALCWISVKGSNNSNNKNNKNKNKNKNNNNNKKKKKNNKKKNNKKKNNNNQKNNGVRKFTSL